MKKILKGSEPALLTTYRTANPGNDWGHFCRSTARKIQVQQQLRHDQGDLCAYCEIDLKAAESPDVADFRVEHFHPKSDIGGPINWNLRWSNLIACCHGGSQADVVDASNRHTSPDHSCDVPKQNDDWTDIILNPLQLPASPMIFSFNRYNESIEVDNKNCDLASVDHTKAQATINLLRLDSVRLRDLREAELNRINELLQQQMASGQPIAKARQNLAKALLRKNSNGHWPKFFSAIRHYLDKAAEAQLDAINYCG